MSKQAPCLRVQLIRPNGEITFTEEFTASVEAEARYNRLVEACIKDRWLGARVQCLNAVGGVVHERIIE